MEKKKNNNNNNNGNKKNNVLGVRARRLTRKKQVQTLMLALPPHSLVVRQPPVPVHTFSSSRPTTRVVRGRGP